MYDLTGRWLNKGFAGFSFFGCTRHTYKGPLCLFLGVTKMLCCSTPERRRRRKGTSICINGLLRLTLRGRPVGIRPIWLKVKSYSNPSPVGVTGGLFCACLSCAIGTEVLAMIRKMIFDFQQTELWISTLEQTAGTIGLSFINILWATHWLPDA